MQIIFLINIPQCLFRYHVNYLILIMMMLRNTTCEPRGITLYKTGSEIGLF